MAGKGTKAQNTRKFRDKLEAFMDSEIAGDLDREQTFGFSSLPENIRNDPKLTHMDLLVYRLGMQALSGNDKSIQEILDRLMGKPTQVNENLNISATYEDFLETCVGKDVIEAEVVEVLPPPRDTNQEFEDLGI